MSYKSVPLQDGTPWSGPIIMRPTWFIGWADNHFSNLLFNKSLETKNIPEMGIG